MKTRLLFILYLIFVFHTGLWAQEAMMDESLLYSTKTPGTFYSSNTDTVFLINDISVNGIKRTRKSTVLRELSFAAGDAYSLPEIIKKLDETRRQLMNTNLFRRVEVYLNSLQDKNVFVTVEVEEKWYFFPQPFIRLANGTFSQWNDRGRKLEHLNYGLKLTQFNFSGRGDKMHLHLTNGYTKKVALQYQGFFLDKALKWSSSINFAHGKNRELNYATENNKLLPIKNPDGYLFEFYQASVDVNFRPAIKTRHNFSIGYNVNRVADTVSKLNANYAPESYRFPFFTYNLSFTDLDFNPYPTRGRNGEVSLHKAGLNNAINLWQLSAKGTNFWAVSSKTYFSIKAAATIKLPFKQPYITQQMLGYGDAFLQGYENYIIDGVAGGYTKATLGFNVFNSQIPLPNNKWFKNLRSIPFRLYLKTYGNTGYVHNPNVTLPNGLNNRMLYSGGIGLDIVAFTDLLFKFEWSVNGLGQNGLYLHQ